jgi:hypothetical protein
MPLTALRAPRFSLLLIGTVAVVVLGVVLFGVDRGWLSGGREDRAVKGDIQSQSGPALSRTMPASGGGVCMVCGTVQSIGQFPSKGDNAMPASFRVTVRMDDGSFRSFAQSPERQFVVGERVRVVDGSMVAEAM